MNGHFFRSPRRGVARAPACEDSRFAIHATTDGGIFIFVVVGAGGGALVSDGPHGAAALDQARQILRQATTGHCLLVPLVCACAAV